MSPTLAGLSLAFRYDNRQSKSSHYPVGNQPSDSQALKEPLDTYNHRMSTAGAAFPSFSYFRHTFAITRILHQHRHHLKVPASFVAHCCCCASSLQIFPVESSRVSSPDPVHDAFCSWNPCRALRFIVALYPRPLGLDGKRACSARGHAFAARPSAVGSFSAAVLPSRSLAL